MSETELAALWGRVRAETTAARASWRDRLRELPTGVRVTLALSFALVITALLALAFGLRPQASGAPLSRVAAVLGALATLAAASFAVSLRGIHQRPLKGWAWAVIGIALAVPIGLALMPAMIAEAHADATVGLACLVIGITTGALVSVPVFLMQRASVPVLARACAALAGGGAVAFALLELHCPSRDVTHLLIGHAAVGAVLVVISAVVVGARR